MVFSSVYRTIGLVLAVIVVIGFVVYVVLNVVRSGKDEVGSEMELAPNRKPYLDDEQLEGSKLDRALTWGLFALFVSAIGLPLYWILEPGRQSGAAEEFGDKFASRGGELFDTTENGGLNCAFCHGGMEATGGVVDFNRQLPDGSVEPVQWKAPALNTVMLRYSRAEVEYILVYGRQFSPMPAWGVEGGGPLNEQQIQNLVDYLESIQLSPEEAQAEIEGNLRETLGLGETEAIDYRDAEVGEALFNLGLTDNFAGGAYACGRCHSQNWSFSDSLDDLPGPGGGAGAFGPSLFNVGLQFPRNPEPADGESVFQEQIDFISLGSEDGEAYGSQGQGTGRMPGFGQRPEEEALFYLNDGEAREPSPGMMTPEMIEAIVIYERSLGVEGAGGGGP